jgi:hypothetical protein
VTDKIRPAVPRRSSFDSEVVRMRKTRKKLPYEDVSQFLRATVIPTYNSEPGEQHVDTLICELHKEEQLPQEGVMTPEDLVEVGEGVDGSEE